MWSTGAENANPLQYSGLENPTNSMKRQKDMTLEDEPARLVGVQYTTREEQRNSSTRNQVQFNSVAQLCPTFCDPLNLGTPGLPVHHQLLESTQTHAHCVSDAIQSSHALLSCPQSFPTLGSFQMSQLFTPGGQILELQLQHQSL